MLEILAIVHVVGLAIDWVLPGVEVRGTVLNVVLFFVLAHGTLLLFNEILVICGGVHVTVLERSLIRSSAGVCRRYLVVQPGWEIIHLQREVAHTVHHVSLFWVRSFPPDHLGLALLRLDALQRDLTVPVTRDRHQSLVLLLFLHLGLEAYFTLDLSHILVLAKPSAFVEVDEHLLIGVSLVNRHYFSNVDVRGADNEIVQ